MESVRQWFQDWSDACEYARECAPDLSLFAPHEPYSALGSIAAVCFLLWWSNEKRINRQRASERHAQAENLLGSAPARELQLMLERMKDGNPASAKKAA
jgi:hypothetical protein